jgi:hypothetical protein
MYKFLPPTLNIYKNKTLLKLLKLHINHVPEAFFSLHKKNNKYSLRNNILKFNINTFLTNYQYKTNPLTLAQKAFGIKILLCQNLQNINN